MVCSFIYARWKPSRPAAAVNRLSSGQTAPQRIRAGARRTFQASPRASFMLITLDIPGA